MRHWNRGRKTVRNFLLALLLAVLVYASQGFPPYTVRGMCRQVQHDYLLGELEPLYVERSRAHFSSSPDLYFTLIAARSRDTYTIFRYENGLLGSHRDWYQFPPVFGEGAVCASRAGTVFAAGSFEEAVSASAVIRMEKAGTAKSREFVLEGERLADQVFAFPYELRGYTFDQMDYMDMTLPQLSTEWYSDSYYDGNRLLSAEVPCTVTLYDGAGEVLEVFQLALTAEALRSYW